jgi:CRISPR/Cas system-associated protein Cas7 (RAMP superfamily)
MTSTIIPTFSSSIGVIQLKLTDCGMEKIDFEKILMKEFQARKRLEMLIKTLV